MDSAESTSSSVDQQAVLNPEKQEAVVENATIIEDANEGPSASSKAKKPIPESRKLKKKRKQVAQGKGTKQAYYDVYGPDASASIEVKTVFDGQKVSSIRMTDVRDLIRWILADAVSPKYFFVKNKPLVEKVCVVILNGLDHETVTKHPDCLPTLLRIGQQWISTTIDTFGALQRSSFLRHLFMCEAGKKKREDRGLTAYIERARADVSEHIAAQQEKFKQQMKEQGIEDDEDESEEEEEEVDAESSAPQQGESKKRKQEEVSKSDSNEEIAQKESEVESKKKEEAEAAAAAEAENEEEKKRLEKRVKLGHNVFSVLSQLASGGIMPVSSPLFSSASSSSSSSAPAAASTPSKSNNPMDPRSIIATLDDLKEHGFPLLLPKTDVPEGHVRTVPKPVGYVLPSPSHRMMAIDCEMCLTSAGLELTRVSVVDESLTTLYDSFVLPSNPIVDYNTRYSGITAEHLAGVTTTLQHVQQRLSSFIFEDTILVGHSLENDLKALKLFHTTIIDTSIIFPHPRGLPYKSSLKYLVQKYLRREIQHLESGHDSTEDASCCMELIQLKLNRALSSSNGDGEQKKFESLLTVVSRYNNANGSSKKSCWIDQQDLANEWTRGTNASALPAYSDESVASKTVKSVRGACSLIVSHLHDLERLQYTCTLRDEVERMKPSTQELEPVLKQMDARLRQIYESCPHNTALIVLSGQGNTNYAKKLQTIKFRGQRRGPQAAPSASASSSSSAPEAEDSMESEAVVAAPVEEKAAVVAEDSSSWTEDDEQRLREALSDARTGLAFFQIKE